MTRVGFETSANEIAKLLVLVGGGDSCRKAAQAVRLDALRFTADGNGFRWASREFGLAGRYLDLFGEAIDRELAPTKWPRILVLDSKPLHLRPVDAAKFHEPWDPTRRAGAVLAAAGSDDPAHHARAWRLSLAGDETKEAWLAFFDELPGDDVEWVVADGSKAIKAAVKLRWPNAQFIACEWHLKRALKDWALRDGWPAKHKDFAPVLAAAFDSEAGWDALVAFTTTHDADNLLTWIEANEPRVRPQIALRQRQYAGYPRSNGAAEGVLKFVDRKLHRNRRFRFRNAGRLRTILNLMRADQAGQSDQVRYANVVKRELEKVAWDAKPGWNEKADCQAELSSLSKVLLTSRDRAHDQNAVYVADAKVRSVVRRIDEDNAERQRMGYPPLTYTVKLGQRTISVDVAGTMLTDYPEIARDWDYGKNTVAIESVTGGADLEAHWKCHRCGCEWQREVAQRTKRRTRCRQCATHWTTVAESVAGKRPDLILEWAKKSNGRLTPESVKATYPRTVVWQCPDPRHGPYRMSPRTRVKIDPGKPACPLCKRMTPAKVHQWTAPVADDELPF